MAIKTYNDQNFVAIANAIRSKSKNPTTYKPSEMAAAISAIESGFELLPQDTVSGAIANFPDGSDGYPVVELIANIEPKQSGSGDPAPDNVRPISGYTGMSISKIGSNIADFSGNIESVYSGLTIGKTPDGGITFSGTPSRTWAHLTTDFPIFIKVGTTLTLARTEAKGYIIYLSVTYEDNTGENIIIGVNATKKTYTLPKNAKAIRLDISSISTSTEYSETVYAYLNVGSEATDYEPYQAPEVKTIDLGRTVYVGSLNVTTGVLTITHGKATFDGSENGWSIYSGGNGYSIPLSSMMRGTWYNDNLTICSNLKKQPDNTNLGIRVGVNNDGIYIVQANTLSGVSDLTTFKNWLSNNNLSITYPLATPETYQLTAEEVKTLLGVNNISADTGNVSLTYRADVDLYIAKKIAEGA